MSAERSDTMIDLVSARMDDALGSVYPWNATYIGCKCYCPFATVETTDPTLFPIESGSACKCGATTARSP